MKIVIAGGGTAGWLTAAILDKKFNNGAQPFLDITLVESPGLGRIGVGEATVPTLRRTLAFLGITEKDFLASTAATLKHGIRFVDWLVPDHVYFHPFEAFAAGQAQPSLHEWMVRHARQECRPFAYDVGTQVYAADAQRSPKRFGDPDYSGFFNYAYHLDAERFADLLRSSCLAHGVRHVECDIRSVRLDTESGNIAAVHTDAGEIRGDFFVDCTGFSSLLLQRTLRVPFKSFADHLPCDRAVTARRVYEEDVREIEPFTTATALPGGWEWRIGLRERSGHGYVFASDFISDDEAECTLRQRNGLPDSTEVRLLKFPVGRVESSWVRNCVAIGLSGGFIEPLESTGILLIEEAARLLAQSLPISGEEPSAATAFNRHMARLYDEIRDFVVLHYCLTARDDTEFWKGASSRIPDRLDELLRLWAVRAPVDEDLDSAFIFNAINYRYILYGMDQVHSGAVERARHSLAPVRNDGFEKRRVQALELLPGHLAWLQANAPTR